MIIDILSDVVGFVIACALIVSLPFAVMVMILGVSGEEIKPITKWFKR